MVQRQPPREFMDATMRAIAEHGAVENPAAVAAATWRKMGKKARQPWEILRSLREKGIKVTGSASPVTALAPLGPEVAIPAAVATKAARTVTDILTGDIVVIHSTIPRGTKKNPLPPLDLEYHVNLAALGIGALAIALAALAGVVAWNGFGTLGGGFPGIKTTTDFGRRHSMPPSPSGGLGLTGSPLTCGPECIAAHLLDPWNIAACTAECIARRSR